MIPLVFFAQLSLELEHVQCAIISFPPSVVLMCHIRHIDQIQPKKLSWCDPTLVELRFGIPMHFSISEAPHLVLLDQGGHAYLSACVLVTLTHIFTSCPGSLTCGFFCCPSYRLNWTWVGESWQYAWINKDQRQWNKELQSTESDC